MARHQVRGRHILITGATGLGRAMALKFAQHGAKLGLIARRQSHLEKLQRDIEALGGQAAYVAIDVVDTAAHAEAAARLEAELGPIYGLVANAGIGNTKRGL